MKRMLAIVSIGLAVAAQAQTNVPPTLAQLPHWPIGLLLPETMLEHKPAGAAGPRADVLVWVPDGAKRIRAVLLIPDNTDSKHFGEHAPLRAVAAKHELAIVYFRGYQTGIEWTTNAPDVRRMPALLDWVAGQTGIGEFRHAPWLTFGKSSRGSFPFRMAWIYPERTIATMSYHAETPTWPPAAWAKLGGETILEVNVNGESEWGGTWFHHVRPSLLNYRAQTGWLAHQAVVKGVGHGDYVDTHGSPGWGKPFPGQVTCIRVWDYLALFVDKALQLRLPKGEYPTEGPVALKAVDEAAGYLIDPFAVEEIFGVPHFPLVSSTNGYLVGGASEPAVSGYAAVPPSMGEFPSGVPVVAPVPGRSPSEWLITEGLPFAMKADPIADSIRFADLRPKPGDALTVDGVAATFSPIAPSAVGANGGIAAGKLKKGPAMTLFAYTVLDVPAATRVKVRAPFTVAGRLQVVLNGMPVEHKQVLDLQKGRYPLLTVLRLNGVTWATVEPCFEAVSDAEVEQAKAVQAENEARRVELAKIRAAGPKPPASFVRKAADVPQAERRRMFWVADRELADAWLRLHTREGF